MLKGWKTKTDSEGNIVFCNPKIVYRYDTQSGYWNNNTIRQSA